VKLKIQDTRYKVLVVGFKINMSDQSGDQGVGMMGRGQEVEGEQ
jgi:hypothetical protein